MSRLIVTPRAGHVHRDWDSQPVIQPGRPRRRTSALVIVIAFVVGLTLGRFI